jgi:hypothetical protein
MGIDDPIMLWIAGGAGLLLIFLLIVIVDRVFNLGLDFVGRLTGKKRQ